MKTFEIKHRFTGAILYSGEGETLRDVVEQAISSRADLARADLAGADLAGANLVDADLARADLAAAYLVDADLAGANLAAAYLVDADLAGASLAGANLAAAYLARADLAGANLAAAYLVDADLAGANLADANLVDANLAGARNIPKIDEVADPAAPYKLAITPEEREQRRLDRMMRFRARNLDVPVIEKLDTKILDAVTKGGGSLEMGNWHQCDTTHCRAGWAIHLAGKAGYDLERKYGAHHAGRMLYIAATGRVPHFFADNDAAMADIRACANGER